MGAIIYPARLIVCLALLLSLVTGTSCVISAMPAAGQVATIAGKETGQGGVLGGSVVPPSIIKENETSREFEWLNCRIYIQPSGEGYVADYAGLLRKVVHPVITSFRDDIRHFHFFRYSGAYQQLTEDVAAPLGFSPETPVYFIKLRILVDSEQENTLRDMLLRLCSESTLSLGVEVPTQPYDIEKDLGGRFGETRVWQAADMLQAASELALVYATDGQPYDPTPDAQGGARGLMHLTANILCYSIDTRTADWGRQVSTIIGP